ncbi:DUF6318 family protein [Actinomyces sp. oral taxon 180]|uniref:DUF6318 family protein n=1 Tax=Actinomyces sp. oral taxon 180 TaxID=651609 RepID=UPI0001F15A6A|nr:DUF6318 family protein [Actinomyces sp. oral taxon 180]EFU61547.1 hypothetical protein HMPREF9006_0697 [Actinomyces sp. oral taxon 180 str. F0310]
MEIPPLSERPVSQEEEEAFLRSIQPRRGLFGRRFIGPRRWRPGWAWLPRVHHRGEGGPGEGGAAFSGGTSGVAAWLRADLVDWGIRIAVVVLIVAGCYAVYINGVAEGWWRAWGEKPTAIPTRSAMSGRAPTPTATGSSRAPMSGGYQVGPDGVLVRPAEHAASTYTLPELPQAATENSERGAEAAAEHYLALLVYAWNTGDTTPLADMSDPSSEFANTYITNIGDLYDGGWSYGTSSRVTDVLRVEPVPANGTDVPENSILVKFHITSVDGIKCHGLRTKEQTDEYGSTLSIILTWRNGGWKEIQGRVIRDE